MSRAATWVGVSFGAVSRARGGSALQRSRYQTEGGVAGSTFPEGVDAEPAAQFGHWLLLPDEAPTWSEDRVALWTRAARAERRYDAQEARYLDVTWPRQLPLSAVDEAVKLLFGRFRRDGLAVQVDLHVEEARDGLPNPHLHALIATRVLGRDGFSARKHRELPAWFHSEGGRAARRHVAEVLDGLAVAHGVAITFDPRTNRERGLPVPEDRLPRSFIRRPDTVAARDLLTRRDLQRCRRRAYGEAHNLLAASEGEIASLTRQRRAQLNALPRVTGTRPSAKPRLDRDTWDLWRQTVPMLPLAPPVSLDVDGVAVPVGTRAVIDAGDSVHIEGALDNEAGLALLALADWKGWGEMHLRTATAPRWFTPGASDDRPTTGLPSLMDALSWEGVGAVVSAWRARTPGSVDSPPIVTGPSSRITVELERRLAVARLPGSGEPGRVDVIGLMHEAVRDEPPGLASWELWKVRLDLALTVLGGIRDHVPQRRVVRRPEVAPVARADGPDEHDGSTELRFF